MYVEYWRARWEEARIQTALALPFVGRGVVYAYLWASFVVLAAIAAVGQLSWAAVAGVIGPTVVLTIAAFGYGTFQLLKIIPERDQMLREQAEETGQHARPYIQFTDHRTKQNVAVDGPAVADDRLGRTPTGQPVGRVDVCQVAIRNKPPANTKGSTASHAVAVVEYFLPEAKEPVLVLDHARWADNPQPDVRTAAAPLDQWLRRDLYANGEAHWIDVALKSKGEEEWYTLDALACRDREWKNSDYSLAHPEMRVRVSVLAEGMDDSACADYWLYNDGTDTIDISDRRRYEDKVGAKRMAAQKERPLMRDEFFSDLTKVVRKASSRSPGLAAATPPPAKE